jgi:chitinase
VLAPKKLKAFASGNEDASYWQEATAQDYVTDCGGSCNPGFVFITIQRGGATPVTWRSKEDDSVLCCPIQAAPDPKTCTWRGTAPSCNGQCEDGEVALELNRWDDGKYCENGNKVYCCEVPSAKENKCYWTDVDSTHKAGDELFTFAGSFLETTADIVGIFGGLFRAPLADALNDWDLDMETRFCCPPDEAKKWKNCAWHGQPGSCFDDHCDIGRQVQLATSAYGFGESCFPRVERTRVFCCDPTDKGPLFPPVPLDRLFPHPPTGDKVDTDFDLDVDNTWGSGSAQNRRVMRNPTTVALDSLCLPLPRPFR